MESLGKAMIYSKKYQSPIGEIILNSDGEYLIAVCFKDGKENNLQG